MRASDLIRFKQTGQPITMLTAWDALSASLVEEAGADVVLVGDSLAMVSLGHSPTLPGSPRVFACKYLVLLESQTRRII